MPDSTGRLPEAEGADEEVLDMPASDEEGVEEDVLAMPGDPADEEPGAECTGNADQQSGAVVRIQLKGFRTVITGIDQTSER